MGLKPTKLSFETTSLFVVSAFANTNCDLRVKFGVIKRTLKGEFQIFSNLGSPLYAKVRFETLKEAKKGMQTLYEQILFSFFEKKL